MLGLERGARNTSEAKETDDYGIRKMCKIKNQPKWNGSVQEGQ